MPAHPQGRASSGFRQMPLQRPAPQTCIPPHPSLHFQSLKTFQVRSYLRAFAWTVSRPGAPLPGLQGAHDSWGLSSDVTSLLWPPLTLINPSTSKPHPPSPYHPENLMNLLILLIFPQGQ